MTSVLQTNVGLEVYHKCNKYPSAPEAIIFTHEHCLSDIPFQSRKWDGMALDGRFSWPTNAMEEFLGKPMPRVRQQGGRPKASTLTPVPVTSRPL